MNSLIIVKSIHQGNTLKIAERMAQVLGADLVGPEDVDLQKINDYDLIGFGSGIYSNKHHDSLFDLVDKLPNLNGKKVFVFSTSAMIRKSDHSKLESSLEEKGAVIVDEFFCKGLNKNSFMKYIGGMNKGRPNEDDFKRADEFVGKMKGNNFD
ncbi:flavodoxin [Methanohalophilus levihalophilus]|uniref:flavodoxin family protein n=1 Tax=Methanohalophilus levihalophilus TaxID=1431282 RepID=UPI001AE3EEAD|nr:flavodoxin family protein [Methanohalophilus levihalophilus]MBP2029251.1 flavodoxin [Methanohalophilus levihalophilus]